MPPGAVAESKGANRGSVGKCGCNIKANREQRNIGHRCTALPNIVAALERMLKIANMGVWSGMSITFYFDFMSPFAYLGSVAIERLAERRGESVRWRPLLLGVTVIKIMGLKPLPQTPLKGPYLQREFIRQAGYLGVPVLAQPPRISPLPPLRAFAWLAERDTAVAKRFAQSVFEARWVFGEDPSTPDGLARVGQRLDLDPTGLIAATHDGDVKQGLHQLVDNAVAQGVFGVPTFQIGKELFWGTDQLPQVERWLETGGW
jgi:2-hydroxychromene-2-carboxylate isomerase